MAPVERADDVGGIIGGDGGIIGGDGRDGGGGNGGGDGDGDVDITDNIKNTFIVLYSLYISIQNFYQYGVYKSSTNPVSSFKYSGIIQSIARYQANTPPTTAADHITVCIRSYRLRAWDVKYTDSSNMVTRPSAYFIVSYSWASKF